jgi:hypothetical protein
LEEGAATEGLDAIPLFGRVARESGGKMGEQRAVARRDDDEQLRWDKP